MDKDEIIEMLQWINKALDINGEYYYYKDDEDGDHPLTAEEVLFAWNLFKNTANGQR